VSVFLAVDLDEPTRARVSELIETHRAAHHAKWLRFDKLHCTLEFLGNPTADQVEAFRPIIDSLASRHRPLRLQLEGAGTFLTRRAPSVLWLGISGEVDALRALQGDAHRSLGVGEERPFVPHVTLARAQADSHFDALAKELGQFRSEGFLVEKLTLYESSNHVYRAVHEARLSGSPPSAAPC
jgi:2'-5' RNA ligase